MRSLAFAGCLGVLLLAGTPNGGTQEKAPEVRIVKYDGLAQEVLKHRGKVVLVDIWFTL